MPSLLIRIAKRADGSTVLSCTRSDGSVTWQRQVGRQAAFFPRHDLEHYAVETTLGHAGGFYGLVGEGWNLSDFGRPWPKGRLPETAIASELIVGFLDAERASGVEMTANDLNARIAEYCAFQGIALPPRVDAAQLVEIRSTLVELFTRWERVPVGGSLELRFDASKPASPPPRT